MASGGGGGQQAPYGQGVLESEGTLCVSLLWYDWKGRDDARSSSFRIGETGGDLREGTAGASCLRGEQGQGDELQSEGIVRPGVIEQPSDRGHLEVSVELAELEEFERGG